MMIAFGIQRKARSLRRFKASIDIHGRNWCQKGLANERRNCHRRCLHALSNETMWLFCRLRQTSHWTWNNVVLVAVQTTHAHARCTCSLQPRITCSAAAQLHPAMAG
jgi:hypothetical protein